MARTAYVLGVDPGTIVANLRAMVQLVKASAAIPILGAIPPNHRPFASMAQAIIDAVNAQLPAVATEEGILFADTFSPLTNGGLYGSDQLHPNQQGYDVHVHVPSASYVLGGLVLILSERGVETAGPPEGRRRGLGLALVAALAWAVSAALMKPPVQEIDPLTI